MTVELIQGDCLDVMREVPDGSFDAVVTDIPYGVGKASWDTEIPPSKLWHEVSRVLVENGSLLLFSGLRYMPDVIQSIGDTLTYEWVIAWYKTNAMQFGKTGYSKLDLILWYSKGGANRNDKIIDVIEYPIIADENNFGHPTPKPVKVMTRLISLLDADNILDPFVGSGSTGVACVLAGINFTGIDISSEYISIVEKRIHEAQMQPRLI